MADFTPGLITAVESTIASSPGLGGQSFSTIPVPNNALALYTLSIRAPGQAKTSVFSYTFPLTPSALVKDYTAMAAMYDVQGSAAQGGVQRVIDSYGNSPPIWSIEGTTGWQYHSADGLQFTGMESIATLQQLLDMYAEKNQEQANNNIADLYTLEFYDYFSGDFWQVEPIGRQAVSIASNQPLLFRYAFRWAGIVSLADALSAPASNDALSSTLSTPPSQAQSDLSNQLSDTPVLQSDGSYTTSMAG